MQTKNVHYAQQPNDIIITVNHNKALIEFPINITKIETQEGEEGVAEEVYSIITSVTPDLEERVRTNYIEGLRLAQKPILQEPTLNDVIEALNTLTDLVLGGDI